MSFKFIYNGNNQTSYVNRVWTWPENLRRTEKFRWDRIDFGFWPLSRYSWQLLSLFNNFDENKRCTSFKKNSQVSNFREKNRTTRVQRLYIIKKSFLQADQLQKQKIAHFCRPSSSCRERGIHELALEFWNYWIYCNSNSITGKNGER